MRRRLNIACGVLHSPRLLLLDEPTSNVDPESRQRIWGMLHGLRDAGTSLLLTTHLLHEAEIMSDRIAIIDKGRVIACGTLNDLVRDTPGGDHRLTLRLAAPLRDPLSIGVRSPDNMRFDTTLHDILDELPPLLQKIQRAQATIRSLEVGAPDLEAVFLLLTKSKVDE